MSTSTPAPAVSSSSTIWAAPSKEWVIPAKPKPGRKPKKDPPPPPTMDTEVDTKERRVQNRAAQRAFRERKQSQLADLQARVQQYEQGDIERNVALQNIAKRLKEENEKLRKENTLLKEKLASVEEERDSLRDISRKRWRGESTPRSPSCVELPPRKRAKVYMDTFDSLHHTMTVPTPYASSPSSIASSPDTSGHNSFSPIPTLPSPRDMPIFAEGNALSNIFDFISAGKTSIFETGGALDTFDCGFCNENTPCVCRELALQQAGERLNSSISPLKVENGDMHMPSLQLDMSHLSSPISQPQPSILDNLPAYQPPVPLRRRNLTNANSIPLFTILRPSPEPPRPMQASCTGDPSNCLACADDAFGKAFCAAISKTVASSTSACDSCPQGSNSPCGSSAQNGCCGNPDTCGRGREQRTSPGPILSSSTSSSPQSSQNEPEGGTIPCDDAWRQIKSHPNVTFADLDLLAEVVARRSKCTGPRVEISPAPGSITPERGISPLTLPSHPSRQTEMNHQPVLLTDPHAQYHESQRGRVGLPSPPLQLVPQDVLIQCGRQRVREVHADAVRDALRLLDAKFAIP